MDTSEAITRFAAAPVARLATTDRMGRAHIVPIVFAMPDNRTILTAVDHKPKATTNLKRLRNIASQPRVSLLVDHYDDDWAKLWWVRIDGEAVVVDNPPTHHQQSLVDKYPQYEDAPPAGPWISIAVTHVARWNAMQRKG